MFASPSPVSENDVANVCIHVVNVRDMRLDVCDAMFVVQCYHVKDQHPKCMIQKLNLIVHCPNCDVCLSRLANLAGVHDDSEMNVLIHESNVQHRVSSV